MEPWASLYKKPPPKSRLATMRFFSLSALLVLLPALVLSLPAPEPQLDDLISDTVDDIVDTVDDAITDSSGTH